MARKKNEQSTPATILEPVVLCPPTEEEGYGRPMEVICENPECEHCAFIWISKKASWMGELATCPVCSSVMTYDPAKVSISINARGPGAHDGTIGDRKKRMMKDRSKKLEKKQWDQVEPMKQNEGATPRNPTPGGPLDPTGPFAKRKGAKTIMTPSGSVSIPGSPKKRKPT